MVPRLPCFLLLLLVTGSLSPIAGQSTALAADLPKALNADAVSAGASFLLKVTSPWKDGPCVLSAGEVLHAVVRRQEHNAKGKVTSISFEIKIPCTEETPLPVVVTSLLAPTDVEVLSQQQFHGSSFGESTSFGKTGVGTGDEPDMSGRQNAGLPFSSGPMDRSNRPGAVHLGEVYHLPRIRLAQPVPGDTESTVSTTGATLALPARTTFVLQSSRMEHREVAATEPKLNRVPSVQVPRRALIHPCLAGSCTKSSAVAAKTTFGVRSLGGAHELAPYGYRSEGDHEFRELENGATVHFVGNDEVAVTFPSRQLVKRTPGTPPEAHPRAVRVVLLDTATSTLLSVQNWQVQDNHTYLWSLGDHLLVHEGDTLRLLGSGLQEMAFYRLTGPLSALRISPDGRHVLVGEVRELHTAEEHGMLLQADARGPEEEVRWSLLDGQLRPAKQVGQSSTYRLPPVLLDEGLVELRKEGVDRYLLALRGWDSTTDEQLGNFASTCIPTLESTRPDLLVLSSCDVKDLGMHSVFLHRDGSPVLDEAFAWHDLPIQSITGSGGQRIAFAVAQGKEEYVRGRSFHLSSIRSEAAEVVDASHGAMLASVALPAVSPYKEAVALSPDGSRLAVLSGTKLSLFEVMPVP